MSFLEFDPCLPIYFNKGRRMNSIIAINYYIYPESLETLCKCCLGQVPLEATIWKAFSKTMSLPKCPALSS